MALPKRVTPYDLEGPGRGFERPRATPERVCTYHSKDGSTSYADPTFSPRADALAFAQDAPGRRAGGVYVAARTIRTSARPAS